MSLLVISEILGLFGNKLTAENKYSLRNSEVKIYSKQFKCNYLVKKKLFHGFLLDI